MDQVSGEPAVRRNVKKVARIQLLAYRLWLQRCDKNVAGSPENDYFRAERIIKSQNVLNYWLLGSLAAWIVVLVAGLDHPFATRGNGVPNIHGTAASLIVYLPKRGGGAQTEPAKPVSSPAAAVVAGSQTPAVPSNSPVAAPNATGAITAPTMATAPSSNFKAYEWKRDDVIKYGFDQLTAQMKSLLLAAAGVFWFARRHRNVPLPDLHN